MSDHEKTMFEKIIDKKVPSNILKETEDYIIIEDIHPQAPVHVLIIPKKVIPRLGDATDNDVDLLGRLMLAARDFAKQKQLNNGFRIVINNGMHAGETVPHMHLHLFAGKPMVWPPC